MKPFQAVAQCKRGVIEGLKYIVILSKIEIGIL